MKLSFLYLVVLGLFLSLTSNATTTSSKTSEGADTLPSLIALDKIIKFDEGLKSMDRLTQQSSGVLATTTTCSDLVQYTLAKATGLQALNINNATSAQAVAQYFDAPQSIEISGFDFFAYKIDATNGISINVTASIYLAGPDSLPAGAPLATVTVPVDTTFGGGNLSVLLKTATFSSPVAVNQAYCLVVQNIAPQGVAFVFSDYTVGDGRQEWLCSVDLFGTWTRPYNVNVGGNIFDADALFYPYVSYNLEASFTASPTDFTVSKTVNFTNHSSAIFENRMYNQVAFINQSRLSYTWDFGDSSPKVNAKDTMHFFDPDCYLVILLDTLFGWQNTCAVQDTGYLNFAPIADFSFSSSCPSLSVDFFDNSDKVPTFWLWDFGDGNTSTQQNPHQNYAAEGTYTVCLTVVNDFGVDSSCATVNVIKDIFGACCPTTLTITENPITTGTYTAQSAINANTTVQSEVIFKAGNEILLDPNFEITLGATFDAFIEACSMDLKEGY